MRIEEPFDTSFYPSDFKHSPEVFWRGRSVSFSREKNLSPQVFYTYVHQEAETSTGGSFEFSESENGFNGNIGVEHGVSTDSFSIDFSADVSISNEGINDTRAEVSINIPLN